MAKQSRLVIRGRFRNTVHAAITMCSRLIVVNTDRPEFKLLTPAEQAVLGGYLDGWEEQLKARMELP